MRYLLLTPFLLWGCLLAETPVMPKPGRGYIDLRYTTYHANHFWDDCGKKRCAYNDFQMHEATLNIQYGLTEKDSFTLKAAYARFIESVNRNRQGLRDFELGFRHHLGTFCNQSLSLHSIVIIPSKAGYRSPLRYGQYGLELSLWGYRYFTLGKRLAYLEWKGGYRLLEKYPSDQLIAKGRFGYFIVPRFKILSTIDLTLGALNGSKRYDESAMALNLNYRVLDVAIQAELRLFGQLILYIGGYYRLLGKNIGTGGGGFGGIFYCF